MNGLSTSVSRKTVFGTTAAMVVGLTAGAAHAELFLYDGFLAGGSDPDPSAGEYESDTEFIRSGDGSPGDALFNGHNNNAAGQNPTVLGFDGPWGAPDAGGRTQFAESVYPRVESGGLEYTDSLGQSLITSPGHVNFFRDASITHKQVRRELDDLRIADDEGRAYASMLMQFDEGMHGRFFLNATTGSLRIGINEDGRAYVDSSEINAVPGDTVLDPGVPHLLLVEIFDNVTEDDDDLVNLYVNPSDLTDPLADGPEVAGVEVGEVFQSSENWFLEELDLWPFIGDGGSVYYDEFRLGSSPTSVVPIPEPTSVMLLGAGGALMLLRRRRRA